MSSPSLIGTTLAGRYRIDALLGEGGMGCVYRAEHVHMRKTVALKVLHRELLIVPELMARFEREALAAAHINHPNVAAATDFGKLPDGTAYLVLEYVEGRALTELIDAGLVPLARALKIVWQITSALEAAHALGIVHRDLKPDNIHVLSRDGCDDLVKVLDFGIAKMPADNSADGKAITQVGLVYGTAEYMAPEQALGQVVDARADLYALGVVFFELLAGVRPYDGPAVALLGQQLSRPLPYLSERNAQVRVPYAVEGLIRELLSTSADSRPESAKLVRERLERALMDVDVSHPFNSLPPPSWPGNTGFFEDKVPGTARYGVVAGSRPHSNPRSTPPSLPPLSAPKPSYLKRWPLWLAGGLGALSLVGSVWMSRRASSEQAKELQTQQAASAAAAVSTALPRRDPAVLEEIHRASAQGMDALLLLSAKYPAEGAIWAELALRHAELKQYPEAVAMARRALSLDPLLNENSAIAGALYRAAQNPGSGADAIGLLSGAMGSAGADILFDLGMQEGIKSTVKNAARRALFSPAVKSLATPALLVAIELEEGGDCETLLKAVRSATLKGDARSLPALRALAARDGCGKNGRTDCYPCLRSSQELEMAIKSVSLRAQGEAKP